jgi:transposase-like protein
MEKADPPNSKLTPSRHKAIVEALRQGLYIATTARLVGVSRDSLFRWLKAGEADAEAGRDTGYARLYLDASEAQAQFEAEMVGLVANAARANPQNWPAAMTILERMHPDRFGRRDTTVLEGGDRPAIVVNVGDPETRELTRGLLRRLSQPGPPAALPEGVPEVIDVEPEGSIVDKGSISDDVDE